MTSGSTKDYDALLSAKIERWQPAFGALNAPDAEVYPSPPEGFRLRAEFRIWHEGGELNYVMFPKGDSRSPQVVEHFPIASVTIQQLMPVLRERLKVDQQLRRKLFQVEFLSTLAGDQLVTLIYHRPLDDDWEQAATALAAELSINIVGRSRKQKRIIGRDWVEESLTVNGESFHYRQPEQAFSQPNGAVNTHMLSWAQAATANATGDLLELYCGVGNFTLPLAQNFERVLATEMSKAATAAAQHNLIDNGIDNVHFARLSAEEMTEAMAGKREFRRLATLPQPLTNYELTTLFVDPPRAGLDAATLALAADFETIVYISCNPETLLANLMQLDSTHHLEQLAFFDQFPYTDHLESGVLLRRRASN